MPQPGGAKQIFSILLSAMSIGGIFDLDRLGNQNSHLVLRARHLYIGFCGNLNPVVALIRRLTYI